MSDGRRLWELPGPLLVALVGKAALYLPIGGIVFGLAVRRARDRGVVAHY